MQQSFVEFLADRHADTDTILQATRYYLAERTDDLSPEEMRQQLVAATGDAKEVDSMLRALENDPLLRENASLALLSFAWEEPGEAEKIQSSVDTAKTKLPVIELAILAIVCMYGMYLITTSGIKKRTTVTTTKPDGSREEEQTEEWFGPAGPLHAIVDLFNPGKNNTDKDEEDT